ncbi:hypothetical protein DC498_19385 [Terrimonas sp.]|nr:hypothetical protein DC498_19385 [Terrimonas sp.]
MICFLGWLLIAMSYNIPQFNERHEENFWRLFLRDIGIALFPIGLVALMYEIFLRNNFIGNMTQTIKSLMPSRYTNMRESGLIDIYPDLRIDKLKLDIENVHKTEIKIIDIWMENFNRIESAIVESIINRNCEVKIMLWDPKSLNALENRARALGNGATVRTMVDNIIGNLRYIDNIFEKLESHPNLNKFEVKFYNSFIGVHYICIGDECLVGTYLRERVSSMGTIMKVAGKQHFFFQELEKHFISQWNDKANNSTISLSRDKIKEYLDWYDEFIIAYRKK